MTHCMAACCAVLVHADHIQGLGDPGGIGTPCHMTETALAIYRSYMKQVRWLYAEIDMYIHREIDSMHIHCR